VLTEPHSQDRKGGGAHLGRKQEIEEYLTQKAATILDQLYDPGVAVVNIDVTLGNEQVQLTHETYNSPEKSGQGGIAAKSKTQRKFAGGTDDYGTEGKKQLSSEVVETDYRVDKKVEQVVKGEGAIERMTVSVMVPRAVDAVTLKAIRQLVANAVGLRESRGDAIEVSSLPMAPAAASSDATTASAAVAPGAPRAPVGRTAPQADSGWGFAARALLVALVLALAGGVYAFSRRGPAAAPALPAGEREALLRDVKHWFESDAASAPDAPKPAPGAG
jgi:flagellar M-ring protein FliF